MPADEGARAAKNVGVLLAAAKEFRLPVIVTEQYPKGLGRTIPSIEDAVRALPVPAVRAEKVEFNAACAPAVATALGSLDRRAWIVTGLECHVCVYQTARELVRRGLTAHVVEDAVVSRRRENWEAGLRLMAAAGAVVTTTETVVFDLLGA